MKCALILEVINVYVGTITFIDLYLCLSNIDFMLYSFSLVHNVIVCPMHCSTALN